MQNLHDPLDLAAVGNGRIAALIDTRGRIAWWCFPRFDADPVFCSLLSKSEDKGFCDVLVEGCVDSQARYVRNTAIVETLLTDTSGNSVRIVDFAPRFNRYERVFHPPQIIRRIEPASGLPRLRLRVRPCFNYGVPCTTSVLGSNHIRYAGGQDAVRLTTDAPLSYIAQETAFALTRPITLILGPDEPLMGSVEAIGREFLELTSAHWLDWVRSLALPLEWQKELIRAAITLKLCSFDETGAIVAALTTSIPEAAGTHRNWDYRFCWLRDAYFVIKALNRLGATQTMESFINYITTIAIDASRPLRPVYGIIPDEVLTERVAPDLSGFDGTGMVRVGNQASEQTQHDAYGSVILGASQMFIDQRLPRPGDEVLFKRLEPLGEQARALVNAPDAGIWEYRGRLQIHTHSATMCWVAADRLAKIAGRLGLSERRAYWRSAADATGNEILKRSWSDKRQAMMGAFGGNELDASVLLLPDLGLISATDERFVKTCDLIGRELNRNGYIMRYTTADDFGAPETAFLTCQFWYIDALAGCGRKAAARELFVDILQRRNKFGLLSEDIHPATGHLWGNLPQTYSMAGIINTGRVLSRSWDDAWSDGL